MSIRRVEGTFEGARDGGSLFRRAWEHPAPARLLIVVHGFAEHTGRYEAMGSWFAERGAAVHALDLRGHGRSKGRRNHVVSFDDFLDDLALFFELVRGEHPDLPLTLVGHSMGGLIATAYTRERDPEMLALVTSGAALALAPGMSRMRMRLARLLRSVAPRFSLDAGLPLDGLSRDPEVVRRYVEDDLVDTRMTMSLAVEMLDAVERTAGGGREIRVPMLLLHGGDDTLCDPSGSRRFFESLRRDLVPPSELKIYPGLRHEIFQEPEREEVYRDLLEWVCAREREAVAEPSSARSDTHAPGPLREAHR